MNLAPSAEHFNLERCLDFAPLREALQQGGFTAAALNETMAIQNPAEGVDMPVVLLRTEAVTPYNTLIRLFILEQIVSEESARQALSPMPLEPLFECNLLRRAAGGAQSTVKLAPYDNYFFVSDFSQRYKHTSFPPDFVLGVGPASVSLINLTVRASVETVLDVGCGAGIQSILASTHSKKVVGTDTSPRALNFAAFNARLNGVRNVEWRWGSFFEPAPESFDLIVINPPFVISPASSLLYRDGSGQGDSVSEHVVRTAPEHLNEGGFAAMLINWHHQTEEDWPSRPRQWLENNGCDSWLLRFAEKDPLSYAATWLRQTAHQEAEEYSRSLTEWLAYYKKAGIARISSGGVILRKRFSKQNWIRSDSFQGTHAGGSCGEQVARIFAAEDLLRSLADDDALLQCKLSVQPDLRINQRLALREGQWVAEEIMMNLVRGLPFPGHADPQVVRLLSHANGQRTLGECIGLLERDFDMAPSSLTAPCLGVARKLIGAGVVNASIG